MKIIIIAILVLAIFPFIIGLFLPTARTFVKTSQFKSSPQEIWNVITDIKGQEEWRNEVKSIEIINAKKGKEKWTEIPKKGRPITFKVKTYEPPNRFDIEIMESGFSGYWEGRIREKKGVTEIEFKEVVVINNPYLKTLSYLFLDLNKTMDLYLANLKKKLDE